MFALCMYELLLVYYFVSRGETREGKRDVDVDHKLIGVTDMNNRSSILLLFRYWVLGFGSSLWKYLIIYLVFLGTENVRNLSEELF